MIGHANEHASAFWARDMKEYFKKPYTFKFNRQMRLHKGSNRTKDRLLIPLWQKEMDSMDLESRKSGWTQTPVVDRYFL